SFGVQAKVADDIRMHLSGAGDFKPFSLVGAAGEHHVDFSRRFGKWEKGWSEPNGQIIRFKECPEEMRVYPLEIGKGNVVGDPQALDMVKNERKHDIAVYAVREDSRNDIDG